MRQLFNIMKQTEQVPLNANLLNPTHTKTIKAFIVPDVGKHGFNCTNSLVIQLSAIGRVYVDFHLLQQVLFIYQCTNVLGNLEVMTS